MEVALALKLQADFRVIFGLEAGRAPKPIFMWWDISHTKVYLAPVVHSLWYQCKPPAP